MNRKQAEDLRERVAKLAYQYEQEFGGCSQAVVGAFKNVLGSISDDTFKAATGFAGGIGLTGNTCGAVSGGIIVLSTYMGRDYQEFADTDGKRFDSFRLAKELVNRFESEYGSAACCKIQEKIIGRSYDIWTERDEFLAAGGHDDKCPSVCANAARWIVEILNENELLEKN